MQAAVQERLTALAADKGKAPAVAANGAGQSGQKAAKAAAAQHPLAAPPAVLERLRKDLRLSKLQANTVWRVLLFVVGKGEPGVVEGLRSLILGAILAEDAATKGDAQGERRQCGGGWARSAGWSSLHLASLPVDSRTCKVQAVEHGVCMSCRLLQRASWRTHSPLWPATHNPHAGKSVRETDKGFVMCRGASTAKSEVPLLPVEEQSVEQQAEAVEEAAEAQLAAAAAVAAKFLGGLPAVEEEGEEEEDDD